MRYSKTLRRWVTEKRFLPPKQKTEQPQPRLSVDELRDMERDAAVINEAWGQVVVVWEPDK